MLNSLRSVWKNIQNLNEDLPLCRLQFLLLRAQTQTAGPLIMGSRLTAQSLLSRFISPWKKNTQKRNSRVNRNGALPELLRRRFSLAEIIAATEDFNHSLYIGSGIFASVYKGSIDDGATVVAIKRLSPNIETVSAAFKKEVLLFCQLQHPNLVSFIGFCEEDGECILVYEYMPNDSLGLHLFIMTHKDALPWKQRLNICIGVASGLHYLHTGVKHAIIHRDIKSLNILLDQSLVPKLSAFGLSKMGPPNSANVPIRVDSRVEGSIGYLDPEYCASGQLTEKSDVYSFGVVLFEVLCAKTSSELRKYRGCENILDIVDPFLVGKVAPDCLKRFIEIANRCLRSRGAERPTVGEVLVQLEFALELQERADASKQVGTITCLNPAGDFSYDEMTFPVLGDDVFYRSSGEEIRLLNGLVF